MELKLRTRQGGRLEVLDAAGQRVEGVQVVELFAAAPDFIPRVRIEVRPSVAVDATAEVGIDNGRFAATAGSQSGEKAAASDSIAGQASGSADE
jgi:hypothetical protein